MPQIVLQGARADAWFIQALMLFPNDARSCQLAFYRYMAGEISADRDDDDEQPVSAACLRALLNMSVGVEDWQAKVNDCIRSGRLAGRQLGSMYWMHIDGTYDASMSRAERCTQEWARGRSWGDGVRMNHSPKKLEECRKNFRRVAHLWAAWYLLDSRAAPELRIDVFSEEVLPVFLGIAATVHQFGTTFIPNGAKTPPLHPAESTWALPKSIHPLKYIGPRPDLLVEEQSRYDPPKRRSPYFPKPGSDTAE